MRWLSRLTILVLLALAAACAPNSPTLTPLPAATNTALPPTEPATPAPTVTPAPTATPVVQTTVRIIHAAPDAPTINIFAGQAAIATNLNFSQASEATPIDAGIYALRVMPTGAAADSQPLVEAEVTLRGHEPLLLVLTGTGNQLELLTLPEPLVGLNADESAVTLLPVIPNGPQITLAQGDTALTSTNYGQAKPVLLAPGNEPLELRTNGTTLQTFNNERPAGTNTLLLVAGDPNQPQLIALTNRAPGKTALRVVNVSAINSIDIYVDNQLFAHQAEYGKPVDRQEIVTGDHTITAYAANNDPATTPPLAAIVLNLENNPYSTLYLLGSAEDAQLRLEPDDLNPTSPEAATITFVNTLSATPQLRLEINGEVFANVAYGEAPPTVTMAASRYTFFWVNANSTGTSQPIEVVENLELQAGYSYLYLITGRLDTPPLVIGENVGTTEALAETNGEPPAQVRLINTLEDQQPVNLLVNETSLATVAYGQGSDLLNIPPETATVNIQAGDIALAQLLDPLASGQRYTLVAYGLPGERVNLLLLPDDNLVFGGDAAHLRLINASMDRDVSLGLGYTEVGPAILNEPEGTEEPSVEQFRRSIPYGLTRLVNDIATSSASANILMFGGTFNLEILDSARTQIATTLASVELRDGEHYDVVAYQETKVPRVRAFVLPYPPRSD